MASWCAMGVEGGYTNGSANFPSALYSPGYLDAVAKYSTNDASRLGKFCSEAFAGCLQMLPISLRFSDGQWFFILLMPVCTVLACQIYRTTQ